MIVILVLVSIVLMSSACTANTAQTRTTGVDCIELTFKSSHSQIKLGDAVQMQFTVTNNCQKLIVIESTDSPVLDIVVTALPMGNIIRQWSVENPDKVSHHMEWKPGESHEIEMTWTVSPTDKGGLRIALSGDVNSGSTIFGSAAVGVCPVGSCN